MALGSEVPIEEHTGTPNAAGLVQVPEVDTVRRRSQRRTRRILAALALLGVLVASLGGAQIYRSRQEALAYGAATLERLGQNATTEFEWAFGAANFFQLEFIDQLRYRGIDTAEKFETQLGKDEINDAMVVNNLMLPVRGNNRLISNSGKVINSSFFPSRNTMLPKDLHFLRDFAENPNLNSEISDPFHGVLVDDQIVVLARRVRASDGTPIGLMASGFQRAYFERVFHALKTTEIGQLAVYRLDGRILYDSQGRDLIEPPVINNSPNFSNFLAVKKEHAEFEEGSSWNGRDRFVFYRRLDRQPLVVAAFASTSTILAAWRMQSLIFGIALMVIEGVILTVALLLLSLSRANHRALDARHSQAIAHQRELQRARELDSLIDTIPGVVTRQRRRPDGTWQMTYVSYSATDKRDPAPTDIPNSARFETRLNDEQRDLLRTKEEEALANGHSSLEMTLRFNDGKFHRVHALIGRIGVEGTATDVCTVWTDVTLQSTMAAQFAQATRFATLGEVAGGLAHELAQPLATITLASENAIDLLDQLPNSVGRLRDKLRMIARHSARTGDLLEHMRRFDRADDGQTMAISIRDAVASARLLLSNRLSKAMVTLKADLPADLPLVLGKEVLIEQVLINIISNACDAYASLKVEVPLQQRVVNLSAEYAMDSHRVVVSVQDNAGGILPDNLPLVFESFFSTKGAGEGTGLGLSICQRSIAEMGGEIWVENLNGGAVFRFSLPTAVA